MTTVTHPPSRASRFSLPNILTYGRIVAIPVVLGCMDWSDFHDGGLWLRWVALMVFIAAGVTDFFDGYIARAWRRRRASAACSTRSPTSCWWRPAC